MIQTKTEERSLEIPVTGELKKELSLINPKEIKLGEVVDPELDKMAGEFVGSILSFDPCDPANSELRLNNINAVEQLGARTQTQAAQRSAMLKEPIRKLMAKSEDGGDVAKALVNLNMTMEQLDPVQLGEVGWFARAIGMIPGVGSPMKKYFLRYEASQTIIDSVIVSLEQGAKTLYRDNSILIQDQEKMRDMTFKLEKTIKLGMLIDQKLEYSLERDVDPNDENRVRFIQEELIFPLRQRIMDLQQQLAVNQQGVLSIEIIIRTNKELIRGVNRAMNVTVTALDIAVMVAQALASQKIVLDKISAVNKTTNNLIAHNAKQLKQQAVATNKQASEAMLDIEILKQSFQDIRETINDISNFRRNALPNMAENILIMNDLAKETEETISRMEKGNKTVPAIELDINQLEA